MKLQIGNQKEDHLEDFFFPTMYLHPLISSSDPSSSSVTPKRMKLARCACGLKKRKLNDVVEEDNAMHIESNIATKSEASLVPRTKESEEETPRLSAKSQLYQLCSVRHWKAPVYECSDEGPPHKKLFTVKAVVEIKEDSGTTFLECFGEPQLKKKMAGEQAAEAALWYLKNVGHTVQTEKASGVKYRQKHNRR